jgi:bacterial leucyl aminopeptidase
MSYTRLNYPAAFACEGNPAHGRFPGDMDPHIHGVEDTMDVDDERGYFSIEVSNGIFYANQLTDS